MVGFLQELPLEDAQISLQFSPSSVHGMVGAGMHHVEIGPLDIACSATDGGEQLFVNPPFKPQIRAVADEFHVVNGRDVQTALFARARTVNLQDVAEHVLVMGAVHQCPQLPTTRLRDRVIRIHPENPLAPGVVE
jgi:hypothetical protein